MIMLHSEKVALVENISCAISQNVSLLIIKNNGLSANAASVLRSLIFDKKLGKMLVLKNKIANLILIKAEFANFPRLHGDHFFFYSNDIVGLIKFINSFFAKDYLKEKIDFLFGYDEGKKLIDKKNIQDIIVLPSKEVIIYRVSLALRFSLMRIAGVKFALMRIAYCANNFNK